MLPARILAAALLCVLPCAPVAAQKESEIEDAAAQKPAAERFDRGKKWAIVIGVNDYVDDKIPDLRYCVADAKLLAATLREKCGYPGDHILTMTSDQRQAHLQPLRLSLQKQVAAWLKLAKEEDTVVVYFSGHGFLDDRGQGFLATVDTDMEHLGLTSMRTDDLRDMLRQCKARQKLLVLDCCHSGGEKDIRRERRPSSEEVGASFRKAGGLITLASCGKQETSSEWPDKQHGVFTYFLAEGLQGKADRDQDGIVSSDEVYQYTLSKVRTTALKVFGKSQQPRRIIGEDVVGVFALARVNIEQATPAPSDTPVRKSREVLQAELAVAEAEYKHAQRELERTEALKDSGAISKDTYAQVHAQMQIAQRQRDRLAAELKYAESRTPQNWLRILEVDVALAAADYALAQAEFRRYEQLFIKQVVTRAEYDNRRAKVETTRAKKDLADAKWKDFKQRQLGGDECP